MPPRSPTRIKAPAVAVTVPANRDQAAAAVRQIGDLNREQMRLKAQLNDQIAALTQQYQPQLDALGEEVAALQKGVQTWAEAHRDELTRNGKSKTANLVTGEIAWRQRPPSCRITGADAVVETLERLGLGRFVRTKSEPNKEAILNEPEAVAGVAGIKIVTGVEDFVIIPFEAEAA